MNDLELQHDDVVSMHPSYSFTKGSTCKLYELQEGLQQLLAPTNGSGLINNGLECEVLKTTGGGWQKGRIRIRFEFVPYDPPAPADDQVG